MKNKAQELELRNIMQGLEEFANFMSFKSNTTGLRVISVETVEQEMLREQIQSKADVVGIIKYSQQKPSHKQHLLNKSFALVEQKMH
jgi:nitrate reductase NapAB chaperone NapD